MRALLTPIAIVSMLLSVSLATPAPAADRLAAPTAASIEKLLRELLAQDDFEMSSLKLYKTATLMDFELVHLDKVSSARWHVEIELQFDFGPPPPYVFGFEQVRRGRYRLVLKQLGEKFGLSRFTPVVSIHPLPALVR